MACSLENTECPHSDGGAGGCVYKGHPPCKYCISEIRGSAWRNLSRYDSQLSTLKIGKKARAPRHSFPDNLPSKAIVRPMKYTWTASAKGILPNNKTKVPLEQAVLALAALLDRTALGCVEGRDLFWYGLAHASRPGVNHKVCCRGSALPPANQCVYEVVARRVGFSVWLNLVGTVLLASSVRQSGCPECRQDTGRRMMPADA